MLSDPIIGPTPDPPTRQGRAVRFGCGLLFGFCAGSWAAWRIMRDQLGLCLAIGVGVAVVFAFLSAVKGDRFWFPLGEWFRRSVGRGGW
jgi:hypothetical protein